MKKTVKGILTAVSLLAISSLIMVGCAKKKGNNNQYGQFGQYGQYGQNGQYGNGYNGGLYNNGNIYNNSQPGQVVESAMGYEKNSSYEMELVLDISGRTNLPNTGNTAGPNSVAQNNVSVKGTLFVFRDNQFCKLPVGLYNILPTNRINYSPGSVGGISVEAIHRGGERIRIDIPSAMLIATNQTYFTKANGVSRRPFNKVLAANRFSISRQQFGCSDTYSVSTPF